MPGWTSLSEIHASISTRRNRTHLCDILMNGIFLAEIQWYKLPGATPSSAAASRTVKRDLSSLICERFLCASSVTLFLYGGTGPNLPSPVFLTSHRASPPPVF